MTWLVGVFDCTAAIMSDSLAQACRAWAEFPLMIIRFTVFLFRRAAN
jgi:hypothetical protein